MEPTTQIKSTILAANQYMVNKTNTNIAYFEKQLEALIGFTAKGSSLKAFSPKNLLPTECLTCVIDVLREPEETKPSLLLKGLLLLHNLSHNREICESFHESFNLTSVLSGIVKCGGHSTGVPIVQESLVLLQKVTYGHKINFQENYVEDLLIFTTRNIVRPENDYTQHCLGILVNLCKDNFAVQSYIKNMEDSKALQKVIMSYISSEDLKLVVFSLSIESSLWMYDSYGSMIFNPKNIGQIFQTLFNVILQADATTMRYAVDLFQVLVKDAKTQQSLMGFKMLSTYVSSILNLISKCTTETVVMIFELFLAFCSVETTRATISKGLLSTVNMTDRSRVTGFLKLPINEVPEPLLATVHWANQDPDVNNTTSLHALSFLTEFYEASISKISSELIYSNMRVQYSAHADMLMPVILKTLGAKVTGSISQQKVICRKIIRAIQLLAVLCGEDDMRRKIASNITMSLFSEILEFQFSNNNILGMGASKRVACIEDWSDTGVEVVIFCMDLMAKLRKSIPEVDGLFCSLLQDSRVVPFLSAGLISSDRARVQTTLQLFITGSSLEGFPTVLLGESIAGTVVKSERTEEQVVRPSYPKHATNGHHDSGIHSFTSSKTDSVLQNSDYDDSIKNIIDKMRSGLEVKDIKSSEIIDIYEHKLQAMQTKENHLQDLLEAKTLALAQADRLIAQNRSRRAQHDAEAHKMRILLQESERRSEDLREQLNEVKLQKESYGNKIEHLQQDIQRLETLAEEHKHLTEAHAELTERIESLERSLLSLRQEHKTLSDMHEMLQKHNESLKHQHDVASEQLIKLQDERKQLSKQLKEKETKFSETSKSLQKLQKEYDKTEKERSQMEVSIDKLRESLEKTEMAKKKLQHENSKLDLVCKQHESDLTDKDEKIKHLQTELEKHTQIAALIHSLSSGKSENMDKVKK
ncbi:hypothetical protein FSP39_016534 [Pinctada imbricata]|uniref:CIP2A N-terminal domain-containing protein n=1 Tax=Pinctada imbricata TaxID=66713 RepID=A0AA88YBD1_PINIB|nr:hypothetical protein FSP39_016534 [Pinctada imbricata]